MKNEEKKLMIYLAGTLVLVLGSGTWLWVKATFSQDERKSGIVYHNREEIRYAGLPKYFDRGAERKLYVDEAPFGSLDYVLTETYSQTQKIAEIKRFPNQRDQQTFTILRDCGIRNCDEFLSKIE
mgnify:CR=1 FL=1